MPPRPARRYGLGDGNRGSGVRGIFLITVLTLAACSPALDLDTPRAEMARHGPYPELVPLAPLLAGLERNPASYDATRLTGALEARAAALRARGTRLRGAVVDPRSRARMTAALSRHAR
ncbi:MAG: hypothetical protein CSA73_01185 [Rhodobacterales bacterium]|nr:MAG: hypothetical protein CSA73_01185 [Rhodobacterales bacterium]